MSVLEKKFCVVGACVNSFGTSRTWLSNSEDAVEHAKKLLSKERNKIEELYVVQVTKIVRPAQMPYEVVDVESGEITK